MKSRWIMNFLLLMATGALSLVAYYQPGIKQEAQALAITPLKQDEIQRIQVHRPLRADLVLTRSAGEQWLIEREPPLAADNFQLNALARLAEQTAVRSYPVSELDLGKLQLDPAYASVTLDQIKVDFGNLEPLEGLRYVRVGDQVHLIPDLYNHLIEADFSQFVRRRLLDPEARITAIQLPGFSLRRHQETWSIEPEREVSADTLQQFINNWQEAVALRIQQDDGSTGGAPIKITLEDSSEKLTFLLSSREPELVLVRPDLGIQYRLGNQADVYLELPETKSEVTD